MNSGNSIWDDLKRLTRQDNTVTQVILVNVAVFIAINLIRLFLFLFQGDMSLFVTILRWLSVPADPVTLLYRPWTLFTYMFLHEGLFHILFNMLWLYWFGKILRDFVGNRKILPIYVLGGLVGAAIYILSFNLFPVFQKEILGSYALGASAGVLAIVVAAATIVPNYAIHLLFFGAVRIKYIALIIIIIDLLSIPRGNAGGHIAHIGGALLGYIFIKQLQKGNDWSIPFNKIWDSLTSLFRRDKQPKVVYKKKTSGKKRQPVSGTGRTHKQKKLDAILDKIAQSGYDSLTKEEKEFLFRVSKDNE